jgi:hypothetical protein
MGLCVANDATCMMRTTFQVIGQVIVIEHLMSQQPVLSTFNIHEADQEAA